MNDVYGFYQKFEALELPFIQLFFIFDSLNILPMKYFQTVVFMFCVFMMQGIAQVPQTHKALVVEKTATWCQYCGGWGWDLQEELEERNKDKAVILQVHPSEICQLYNTTAAELIDSFPQTSYFPYWYVNGCPAFDYNISVYYNKVHINSLVDSTWDTPALANCEYSFTLDSNTLTVDAEVQFFEDTSGSYYLSVWILENNVFVLQEGLTDEEPYHSNVLRASMTESIFGDMLVSGAVINGDVFQRFYSMELDTSWKLQNVHLAFVIWKKRDDGNYIFINAYGDGKTLKERWRIHGILSEFPRPNPTSGMIYFPNPVLGSYSYEQARKINTYASIFDLHGRLLLRKKIFPLNGSIDLQSFPAGTYILKIEGEDIQSVYKIVRW